MPNSISLAVPPRVCAEAAVASDAAAVAAAIVLTIVHLLIAFPPLGWRRPAGPAFVHHYSGLERLGIHAVDHPLVLLVHELALELHRGRDLLVLGGELLLDQPVLLDRLHPREVPVHPLDLRRDQVASLARPPERRHVGERHVAVPGML